MVANKKFAAAIQKKIDSKLDTREQEKDVENAKIEVKKIEGIKNALIKQIDSLDILSPTYEIKYNDLQMRLDESYDKLLEAQKYLAECQAKLDRLKNNKILSDSVYNYLLMFDKVYDLMTDLEKKLFYNNFLEEVQIREDAEKGGQILKSIDFKMPIYYDGNETTHIGWETDGTGECVVLLTKVQK